MGKEVRALKASPTFGKQPQRHPAVLFLSPFLKKKKTHPFLTLFPRCTQKVLFRELLGILKVMVPTANEAEDSV